MQSIILILFSVNLVVCVALGVSALYALLLGLALFCLYAKWKGFSLKEIGKMLLKGVLRVKNILIMLLQIGMLTALWRAGGTIPVIICATAGFIRHETIVLMIFLLNCGVSFLTGTAFGTSATMGLISMMLAQSMGISPAMAGGAILAGVYFGDRCSPVSTSAVLISELTKTDIYDNIRKMMKTALIPFLISCGLYALMGFFGTAPQANLNLREMFSREMTLSWIAILPAAAILALALFRAPVRAAMSVSIVLGILVCAFVQHIPVGELASILARGFYAGDAEVGRLLNGGGVLSMCNVTAIICVASACSGIFDGTDLLDNLKRLIHQSEKRITPFGSVLVTSVAASMLACNQTLSIILTHQLCRDLGMDRKELAIDLENTAVLIAPLVPWSIAGAVPLASSGAPTVSILWAFYLMLVPIYQFMKNLGCVSKSKKMQFRVD